MADTYTAGYNGEATDGRFAPMPEGPQQLCCVDGIFLGHTVEQFQQNPPKLVEKWAYVFQSADFNPATGKRYEVHQEFNISMFETAKLRKFLESWRGQPYTDETARKVELHLPMGKNAFANIVHRTSAAGRVYAVISTIMPLPKKFEPIKDENYERGAWWEQRKADYKAKAEAFLAMQEAQSAPRKQPADKDAALAAALVDDDDSLPF
jgi:hypothetical protein